MCQRKNAGRAPAVMFRISTCRIRPFIREAKFVPPRSGIPVLPSAGCASSLGCVELFGLETSSLGWAVAVAVAGPSLTLWASIVKAITRFLSDLLLTNFSNLMPASYLWVK